VGASASMLSLSENTGVPLLSLRTTPFSFHGFGLAKRDTCSKKQAPHGVGRLPPAQKAVTGVDKTRGAAG
jgi:hypothetical protein